MSVEYLYLVFVALFARALLCSGERRSSPLRLALAAGIQLLALAAMRITPPLLLLALLIIVINLAAYLLERNESRRNLIRFLAALLFLAAFSFIGTPQSSPIRFAPWVHGAAAAVAGASLLLGNINGSSAASALAVLSGALFASVEINNLTRYILLRLKVTPAAVGEQEARGDVELRRGKMIGIVERLLIFYFVLTQNPGAIGFILAAKGFTRFRELNNRDFAEYVLIGTLLSAGGAIVVGMATGLALKAV